MKQAAEIFRVATPGRHEIRMQIAEDDLVVSHIVGRGVHAGEQLGFPANNNDVEIEGIAIHRVRDGKIVEYWASPTSHASCSRWARYRARQLDPGRHERASGGAAAMRATSDSGSGRPAAAPGTR